MFSILDHIDTLIAADFYEENNQPFLSEAMKLLNRPPLEFKFVSVYSYCKSRNYRLSRSLTQSTYDILNISSSKTRIGLRYHSISKARINYSHRSRNKHVSNS